jgi:hypothetical protein
MSKHTPGPWRFEHHPERRNEPGYCAIIGHDTCDRVVADTLNERADLERFKVPKRGRKEKALTAKSIVRGLHNS